MKTRPELEALVQAHWERKRQGKTAGIWSGPGPLEEGLDELKDAIICVSVASANDLITYKTAKAIQAHLFDALQMLEACEEKCHNAPPVLDFYS